MDQGKDNKEYVEKLIRLNRVAKVVKGGRRFSFSAMVVVGDKNGNVGYGFGKANDVSEAIRKSVEKAKRNMITVPVRNGTLPHELNTTYKSSRVLLKPAAPGTGIIAGGHVRAVMEAVGIRDVLSKSIGSGNSVNVVKTVFRGFVEMMDGKKMSIGRGKALKDLWG
ncbi:MAG: 30S ribosomal protein S5 [Spirochaetales bacterium]|nr:30S ribosomal protein S5 [Spirochaetales bacterium]